MAPRVLPPLGALAGEAPVDTPAIPVPPPERIDAAVARPARAADSWRELTRIAATLDAVEGALAASLGRAAWPPAAYDRFRREIAIRPPPAWDGERLRFTVLIDARTAAPFLLRATLRSLQDQTHQDWRALVAGPAGLADQPVGSFATTDARIVFVADARGVEGPVVALDAGTALDVQALAWFAFALARTGAPGAYCDHDHGVIDPALGPVRADPTLYGAYDPHFAAAAEAPAVVVGAIAESGLGEDARRAMLASSPRVAHVPRLLATRLALPVVAQGGQVSDDDAVPGRLAPAAAPVAMPPVPAPHPGRIAIVIPTRDGAALLARAIQTLRATARDAARLDVFVVDNRSTEAATSALFAELEADGAARRVEFDAPFNFSLACNVGARATDAPVVAFVNNDIEMLSPGWDDRLLAALADPDVGVVGARLLYPDGTIQHAGMAFGFGPGGAEHEGRGVPGDALGPGGRYLTNHAVASVTGAFLALRRPDFDAVGGFDDGRLMIAHSDVDLCLRVRELGRRVLYCASIEAVHHEGATRGRNETRAAIAWDEGERVDLIARWGEELGADPGISPYWTRGGDPFATLSEPPLSRILEHIDRSARARPWTPVRTDDAADESRVARARGLPRIGPGA